MSLLNKTAHPAKWSNIRVVREALVLKVLDRFLQRNNVPLACTVLSNGSCLPSSGSRIPTQDACTRCLSQRSGTLLSTQYFAWEGNVSSFIGIALHWFGTLFARQVALQRCRWIGYRPSRESISYGRDVFVDTREDLVVRV